MVTDQTCATLCALSIILGLVFGYTWKAVETSAQSAELMKQCQQQAIETITTMQAKRKEK